MSITVLLQSLLQSTHGSGVIVTAAIMTVAVSAMIAVAISLLALRGLGRTLGVRSLGGSLGFCGGSSLLFSLCFFRRCGSGFSCLISRGGFHIPNTLCTKQSLWGSYPKANSLEFSEKRRKLESFSVGMGSFS